MKRINPLVELAFRYFILIIIAVGNLWIFYFIFTPLTAYPLSWILNLFYEVFLLSGNILLINRTVPIELIDACIAGSAYYLLLILNLATREIKFGIRIKALIFSFLVFLIINILRIAILTGIAVSGYSFFDLTHRLFWYALSTVFVVAIWFAEVKIFKIKAIPFYSDLKFLHRKTRKKK